MERLLPIFASAPAAHWLTLFGDAGIPAGAINSVPQILTDPHVAAREMVVTVPHPTAGSVRVVGVPYKLSRTPAGITRHPPLLGEHTAEVLRERLDLTTDQVEALRSDGAI
jgi:crotonobetainyl-CoA:carnitine CoA-transferase CaiB-like acyl-CoA transferase